MKTTGLFRQIRRSWTRKVIYGENAGSKLAKASE